jgi:serine/threonine protein kinase
MGVVYEAMDTLTGGRVAVKLLNSPPAADPRESKPAEDRFLREARVAAAVPPHPGIVGVLEAGIADGRRYIAMELVQGLPMSEWRKQGSLTVQRHVTLLRNIALAVHHAHEHGIVHRDLKPENILVDLNHQPHLTDFGLAKAAGGDLPDSLTATGSSVGTPDYMSPEQVQGRKDVDRRTDVYALGVLLYEVLAGRRPFQADSSFDLMTRTVNDPIVPPSRFSRVQMNPIVFKNLELICLIALSKNRNDRYPTAAAFAEHLSQWLRGEPFEVVLPRAWRLARARQRIRLALLVAAAVALVTAGLVFFLDHKGRAPALAVSSLQTGAIAEVYTGTNFNALGVRRIDSRPRFENDASPLWKDGPTFWASYRWSGIFEVHSEASYLFQARSKEGVRLFVDSQPVLANWNFHPPTVDQGSVRLEKGLHRLLLEYYHTSPEQTLELSWKPEGESPFIPIAPSDLRHDPASFVPREPPRPGENGPMTVPGAQAGESLSILEATGDQALVRPFDSHRFFWRGHWSGSSYVWWGARIKPGDRLRLSFNAPRAGPGTVAAGFTRASDHGVFRVLINRSEVATSLDLYDPELKTGEVVFKNVPLVAGANELEFVVSGSNPAAQEWGPGSGLYKMGLDYIVVR